MSIPIPKKIGLVKGTRNSRRVRLLRRLLTARWYCKLASQLSSPVTVRPPRALLYFGEPAASIEVVILEKRHPVTLCGEARHVVPYVALTSSSSRDRYPTHNQTVQHLNRVDR